MGRLKKRHSLTIAAAIIIIAAAMALLTGTRMLTLTNADTGRLYAAYPLGEGGAFSVMFVHSVNKSPVTEIYAIKNGDIYVTTCVYSSLGAGVATTVEGRETLTTNADGDMVLSGIDRKMTDLVYIVGTVSDHTLEINGRDVSLRDLCGRNAKVRFSYRFIPFGRALEYLGAFGT